MIYANKDSINPKTDEDKRENDIKKLTEKLSLYCDEKFSDWHAFCDNCGMDFGRMIASPAIIAAIIINEQYRKRCPKSKHEENYHKFAVYNRRNKNSFTGIFDGLNFISSEEIQRCEEKFG